MMMKLIPRVIPVLLLKGEGLYKGEKFKKHKYVGDPVNILKIFNEKEVDEIIILDISITLESKSINFLLLKDIVSEAFMPVGYGGGIKSIYDAEKLFKIGIEKVILNTWAYENRKLIQEISSMFGTQSTVVSIDVKKMFGRYRIYTHSGRKRRREDLERYVRECEKNGAGEIIITSIDREGTRKGYDIELIRRVSNWVNIPVIANGGADSLKDFKIAIEAGASAVAAGTIFVFEGIHKAVLVSYPDYSELQKLF